MICGLCDDGLAEAIVRVDCVTESGEASVFCCGMHLIDGYSAAVILSDRDPVITVLDGVALGSLRCPLCGCLLTIDHQH